MANTINCYTESNGKIEHMFAVAGNWRLNTMPVGWCTNEKLDISGSGDEINYFEFAAGDVYYEMIHLGHGWDFDPAGPKQGLVDCDLHFFNVNTNTGQVTFRISMWHLYAGRVMSVLAADVVHDKVINFSSGIANQFSVAYVEDAIDMSSFHANRTKHDGMLYKIERLTAGDTKTGGVGIIHNELWFPTSGLLGPE